jgi:hypothetical protein
MKRLLAPAGLLTLLVSLVIVTPSHAALFKRCGTAGTFYSGALTLADVQARHISCKKARSFAREFTRKSGHESSFTCSEDFHCQWRGWSCRNDGRSGDVKHRCETVNTGNKRLMVVRWVDRIN